MLKFYNTKHSHLTLFFHGFLFHSLSTFRGFCIFHDSIAFINIVSLQYTMVFLVCLPTEGCIGCLQVLTNCYQYPWTYSWVDKFSAHWIQFQGEWPLNYVLILCSALQVLKWQFISLIKWQFYIPPSSESSYHSTLSAALGRVGVLNFNHSVNLMRMPHCVTIQRPIDGLT